MYAKDPRLVEIESLRAQLAEARQAFESLRDSIAESVPSMANRKAPWETDGDPQKLMNILGRVDGATEQK